MQLEPDVPLKIDMNGVQILHEAKKMGTETVQLNVRIAKASGEVIEEVAAPYGGFFERRMYYNKSDVREIELKVKRD